MISPAFFLIICYFFLKRFPVARLFHINFNNISQFADEMEGGVCWKTLGNEILATSPVFKAMIHYLS